MKHALLAVAAVLLSACPVTGPVDIPCRSNANCPTGSGCNASGRCEAGIGGTTGRVLSISPGTANVAVATSQRFAAVADGEEVAVTWAVEGGGHIASDGTYTAPGTVPDPAEVTITATTTGPAPATATAKAFIAARNPEPTLAEATPTVLVTGSGDTALTLTGAGFVGATMVRFDTTEVAPSRVTATSATVTVPAALLAGAGSLGVRVVNPAPGGGLSTPLTLVVENPTVTLAAVTPASALAGSASATVELTGAGFTADTTARLDGVGLTITARTATQLTATLSAATLASARTATLTVENPSPGGGAATQSFAVQGPVPTITALAPVSVPAGSPQLTVTLTGTGFLPGTQVKVGALALTMNWVSATEVTVVLPASLLASAGVLSLVASTPAPGGGDSAPVSFAVENPVPQLQSLSQSGVPVGSAGFTLTANGGGFIGASTIYWGTTALTTTYVSASRLSAAIPGAFLATPATIAITVVTPAPGGGTTSPQEFHINNPAPALTSLSLTSASAGAGSTTVVATGTNFVTNSVIHFGGAALVTTSSGATSLSATIPASELTTGRQVDVTVVTPTPGGGTSNAVLFTINNPSAALGSLTPGSALSGSGGTALTINGVGFVPGVTVTFGGVTLPATVVNSSQVTTTIPAGQLATARSVTVTASNPPPAGGALNTLSFRVDAVIRTVTGGSGEGGAAVGAALNRTHNFARHPMTGEYYFPQQERHVIWRIDGSGNLQRVTGTGVGGFSGDTGPATAAAINGPRALTFDSSGNLLFSDGNNRIRRIDATSGVITTISGNGTCSTTGDDGPAAAATLGDVYDLKFRGDVLFVAQCGCGGTRVRKIENGIISTVAGTGTAASTGDDGPATAATLNCPSALAWDGAGALYIAEWSGHRVRKVNALGVITTFAGNGSTSFPPVDNVPATTTSIANPRGLVFDASGNLLVSTWGAHRIRRVAASDGNVTTVAGALPGAGSAAGTAATSANIGRPAAIGLDGAGLLTFLTAQETSTDLNALLQVSASGALVTLAGRPVNTSLANTRFYRPFGVAVDAVGNRYVSEREQDRILKVDVSGTVSVVAGTGVRGFFGDGGPATLAQLSGPEGLWLDSSGALYFVDANNARVRKVDPTGTIATVAGGGSFPGGCLTGSPGGVPTSPPAGAGAGYNCIGDDFLASAAVLAGVRFVVGDNSGNLYLSEHDTATTGSSTSSTNRGNRVRRVNLATGYITTVAGGTGLYVNNCTFTGDGGPAVSSTLCAPAGLAISQAGDLFIADSSNRRIRRVNLVTAPVGNIVTVAGTGASNSTGNGGNALVATFRRPFGLAFSGQGNLAVSDGDSHNVRVIDTGNIINPLAGIGTAGFLGDAGAARDANLYFPAQVAYSANSALVFVVDYLNDRLRVVGP